MDISKTFVGKPCGKGHIGVRYISSGQCVYCSQEWYQKNKDKVAKKYSDNKDEIKKKRRPKAIEYYAKNRERLLAKGKEYYLNNKEKFELKDALRRCRGGSKSIKVGYKDRLLVLQKGKCACCKTKLDKYHVDHIVPVSKGGPHEFTNLQLLCPTCNLNKHAKDPVDFMQTKGYLL